MRLSKDEHRWLEDLASRYDVSFNLLTEYFELFKKYDIPTRHKKKSDKIENLMMISTHGYWGDPPPAGVPDTGGQTYYVLQTSKAWAAQGKKVIIIARWFDPYPRVEKFADNLWLIRVKSNGNEFIRKEDIYQFVPEMAEATVAIGALLGTDGIMGHYADGMAGALEVGERFKIPVINTPHSIGIKKLFNLNYDPYNPEAWFDDKYNFWIRESFEIAALRGANLEIANNQKETEILDDYYGLNFPHSTLPAGAGESFFRAYEEKASYLLLNKYALEPNKYIIFFGRLSRAKNISATVDVLAAARKLDPEYFNSIKLVIVGGEPEKPREGEEAEVEKSISEAMKEHDFTRKDVVRIPSSDWEVLSILAYHALFYIGMQLLEPFGMGVAEAMAAGTPVIISNVAGITKWLTDNENALIVDPNTPQDAAKRLVDAVKDEKRLERLSDASHIYAKDHFSWNGIAKKLNSYFEKLAADGIPNIDNQDKKGFKKIFKKRDDRAYHRLAFAWRGDPPIIREKHKTAAGGLIKYITKAFNEMDKSKERLVVALGGESGAGKSEVAEYLRISLRKKDLWAKTLPGDAFFKLTPSENHQARLRAYHSGSLKEYIGPSEVDLRRLEKIISKAKKRKTEEVYVPSDCRSLKSKRYDKVPLNLTNIDVILIDLTYSLLLPNADIKTFFQADYKKRISEVKERNLARDPDQDFDFILKILEIEHNIIQGLKEHATHIISTDYSVKKA